MSWTRYLLHDFWTAREFNRIEDETRTRSRWTQHRAQAIKGDLESLRERVVELEDDLGRVTLLLRALADTCVTRGLLSKAELERVAQAIDASDGTADGKTTLDDTPPR